MYSSDASISEFGDPSKEGCGGYKLTVSKLNNVYFQNIPIDCFESVELSSTVGIMAESKLTERKPSCCGIFSCVGVRVSSLWLVLSRTKTYGLVNYVCLSAMSEVWLYVLQFDMLRSSRAFSKFLYMDMDIKTLENCVHTPHPHSTIATHPRVERSGMGGGGSRGA